MGLNFRKSFKIAPGIRVNLGKKGVSSVSIGGKVARVNVGKKGTRSTIGIPKTGLSYTTQLNSNTRKNKLIKSEIDDQESIRSQPLLDINQTNLNSNTLGQDKYKSVSLILCLGIVVMPYIFSWYVLKNGYSTLTRVVSFIWLFICILLLKLN